MRNYHACFYQKSTGICVVLVGLILSVSLLTGCTKKQREEMIKKDIVAQANQMDPETLAMMMIDPRDREKMQREQNDPRLRSIRKCQKQLLRLHNVLRLIYQIDHGTYPPSYIADANGKPLLSWRVHILPLIGEQKLYDRIHLDEPWNSEHNRTLWSEMPEEFRSETCGDASRTPYCLIVGPDALKPDQTDFCTDMLKYSDTLSLAERATPMIWMEPTDITTADAMRGVNVCDTGIGSSHPGGACAITYNGNQLFLPDKIDLKTLRNAIVFNHKSTLEIPGEWTDP